MIKQIAQTLGLVGLMAATGCENNYALQLEKNKPQKILYLSEGDDTNIWAWSLDDNESVDEALRVTNYNPGVGNALPHANHLQEAIQKDNWTHFVAPDSYGITFLITENTETMPDDMRTSLTRASRVLNGESAMPMR